jgi:hypothetical protein
LFSSNARRGGGVSRSNATCGVRQRGYMLPSSTHQQVPAEVIQTTT